MLTVQLAAKALRGLSDRAYSLCYSAATTITSTSRALVSNTSSPRPETLSRQARSPAQRIHVDIHGSVTELLYWPARTVPDAVLLVVPGNPGVIDFYAEFIDAIYAESGATLEIYAVQHLNHSVHDFITPHILGLNDQIQHKLHVLDYLTRKYNHRPHIRFHLAGHSVGAYICLQLLRLRGDWLKNRLGKVLLLFPTIADIRNTPNGQWIQYLAYPLPRYMASFTALLLSYTLPTRLLVELIQRLLGQNDVQAAITTKLIHPIVAANCLYMAQEEMITIGPLTDQVPIIDRFVNHLVFYYGTIDKWVPLRMWLEVKSQWPQAEVYLCDKTLPHAFVLNHGQTMGHIVAKWLIDHTSKSADEVQ